MTHESDRQLIRMLASFYSTSPSALAKKAGLATTTLTRPLNHEVGHELSAKTLRKLKARFPEFPGFAASEGREARASSAQFSALLYQTEAEEVGSKFSTPVPEELAQTLGIDSKDLFCVVMQGTHMEPDFRDGDWVVIDRRSREPHPPGPFCLSDGDGYTIKFVEKVPTRKNVWRIFSADARFTAFEAGAEEIEIAGRPILLSRCL